MPASLESNYSLYKRLVDGFHTATATLLVLPFEILWIQFIYINSGIYDVRYMYVWKNMAKKERNLKKSHHSKAWITLYKKFHESFHLNRQISNF